MTTNRQLHVPHKQLEKNGSEKILGHRIKALSLSLCDIEEKSQLFKFPWVIKELIKSHAHS